MTNIIEHEDSKLEASFLNPIFAAVFGLSDGFSESFFAGKSKEVLIEDSYQRLIKIYCERTTALQKMLFSYFQQSAVDSSGILEASFFDGKMYVRATAYPTAFMASDGRVLVKNLACMVVLHVIDQHWKIHLRVMDDLKQSVQNAIYERQDPIITFKFEAYHLFSKFMATVSQEIISFLFHAPFYVQLPLKAHTQNQSRKKG